MGELILSAFMDEYAVSFDEQLAGTTRLGLSRIELRGADGTNISQMTLPQVKGYAQKLKDRGVGVSAIGSPLGKIPVDANLREHLETAKRIFEFARILGTRNIRMFSFYTPNGECREQVFDCLGQLVDTAAAFDVVLCHENEAGIYGDTPQRCKELLEEFPAMEAVFDMGNFVLEQVDPWEAYVLLKPHIRYFHIKDALAAGAVVPPGKGEAQIKRILQDYLATRDRVPVSLEPHLQTFDGLNALVGRSFDNPWKYPDPQTAFADAMEKFKEMMDL